MKKKNKILRVPLKVLAFFITFEGKSVKTV